MGDLDGAPFQKSSCIQVESVSLGDIHNSFASGKDDRQPLVLIPEKRNWMWPFVPVPQNAYCLAQKYGKQIGVQQPGAKFVLPSYRLAYIVKKGQTEYKVPVKECATNDNVKITVNVQLFFSINDPEKFVFRIGVVNFDRLLSGTVDEGIRKMVRAEAHDTVRGLKGKGSGAEKMKDNLNARLNEVGVSITTVAIRDVLLPTELRDSLERTTQMQKSMDASIQTHNFEKTRLSQEAEKQIFTLDNQLEELKVRELGRRQQAEYDRKARLDKEKEIARVAAIEAKEKVTKREIALKAEFERAKTEMAKLRLDKMADVETQIEKERVIADNAYLQAQVEADGERDRLFGEARTITTDAEAEAKASKHLMHKRKHELDMREKSVILKLAEKAKFNLIGKSADALVGSVMSGHIDIKGS